MATNTLIAINPAIAGVAVRPLSSFSGGFLSPALALNVRAQRLPAPVVAAVFGRSHVAKRLSLRCGAVLTIGRSEFAAEVLESELPVLVEFVADWCGPCRLISPVIEWASQEYKGKVKIVKIDHDANPELIEQYKVYGLPALILFKNGQEIPESRREGAITKVKIKEYLDSLLESMTAV